MARYLKLGASTNSDRDTSLFVDPPPSDSASKLPSWSILKRAQSTRERRSVPNYSSPAAGEAASRKNPGEFEKDVEQKFDEQVSHGSSFLRRAKSSRESAQVSDKVSERLSSKQLIKPQVSLVRAQSLRYNRIVSADEEEEPVVVLPPRHSCGVERTISEEGKLLENVSSSQASKLPKRMVRVSASYQTREGEILSIECSQCGRWLGTVGRRVNAEEGLVKLCQICHPAMEQHAAGDESFKAGGAGIVPPPDAPGVVAAGGSREDLKRNSSAASGFLRGLRKMLGLKRTRR